MELNIGDKKIIHIKTNNGGNKETAIRQRIEAVVELYTDTSHTKIF